MEDSEKSVIPSIEEQIEIGEKKRQDADAAAIARAERGKEIAAHRNAVAISWKEIQDSLAIRDLVRFLETVKDGHVRVATDGVAQKPVGKDEDGKDIMELVNLTQEQRLGHLDRATGNDEALNYLIRHRV